MKFQTPRQWLDFVQLYNRRKGNLKYMFYYRGFLVDMGNPALEISPLASQASQGTRRLAPRSDLSEDPPSRGKRI